MPIARAIALTAATALVLLSMVRAGHVSESQALLQHELAAGELIEYRVTTTAGTRG